MRSLYGCWLSLFVLSASSQVLAQETYGPATVPLALASAPDPAVDAAAPLAVRDIPASPAVEAPRPSALAAAVAQELALPPPPAPITLVLKADLRAQRLTIEENGKVKYVWPISSGRAGYATRTGTFRPQWASRMHYSRQYDLAPMPHAVFFNNGAAFHGTQAVGYLGRPASHGCIRLAPGNAARLYNLVHKHGFYQTKIVVHGGSRETRVARGEAAKSRAAGRRRDAAGERRRGRRYSRYNGGSGWSF